MEKLKFRAWLARAVELQIYGIVYAGIRASFMLAGMVVGLIDGGRGQEEPLEVKEHAPDKCHCNGGPKLFMVITKAELLEAISSLPDDPKFVDMGKGKN
jgi:hypothetical protein